VVKPAGGAPNWKATRERLWAAFQTLRTPGACDVFRQGSSGTINMLRTSSREEFDIWDTLASAHERGLRGGDDA
jgi:hypothetical protein